MTLIQRLWAYQADRFPLVKHGVLIAAFSACGVCLSLNLRGENGAPIWVFGVAFLVLLGLFMQLRIADEHKDAEIDARYRPARPVPRGLVSLAELRGVGLWIALIQAILSFSLGWPILLLLCAVWAYLALMTAEFFVPKWLKKRPILYMVSHMLIIPMMDLWVTACDWLRVGKGIPHGLEGFVILSFLNGLIIEIGRKIYPPEAEGEGIETYSAHWGRALATRVWLMLFAVAQVVAFVTAMAVGMGIMMGILNGVMLGLGIMVAARMQTNPTTKAQAGLESLSGIWVLSAYCVIGPIALVFGGQG